MSKLKKALIQEIAEDRRVIAEVRRISAEFTAGVEKNLQAKEKELIQKYNMLEKLEK